MPETTTPSTAVDDFTQSLVLASGPEAVFAAITEPTAITQWWAPTAGSGLEDGELTISFGDEDLVVRVTTAQRAKRVTWDVISCEPLPDWAGTAITFELTPTSDGGTALCLTHRGLAALECFDICRQGWERFLPSLVSLVDTGSGNPIGM